MAYLRRADGMIPWVGRHLLLVGYVMVNFVFNVTWGVIHVIEQLMERGCPRLRALKMPLPAEAQES